MYPPKRRYMLSLARTIQTKMPFVEKECQTINVAVIGTTAFSLSSLCCCCTSLPSSAIIWREGEILSSRARDRISCCFCQRRVLLSFSSSTSTLEKASVDVEPIQRYFSSLSLLFPVCFYFSLSPPQQQEALSSYCISRKSKLRNVVNCLHNDAAARVAHQFVGVGTSVKLLLVTSSTT